MFSQSSLPPSHSQEMSQSSLLPFLCSTLRKHCIFSQSSLLPSLPPHTQETSYVLSEEQIEQDELNTHECMLPLMRLLDHMQHNKINPEVPKVGCQSVCLSIYLSVWLSLAVFVNLSLYLSIYLSIYLSVCLFVCLSICLSLNSPCTGHNSRRDANLDGCAAQEAQQQFHSPECSSLYCQTHHQQTEGTCIT